MEYRKILRRSIAFDLCAVDFGAVRLVGVDLGIVSLASIAFGVVSLGAIAPGYEASLGGLVLPSKFIPSVLKLDVNPVAWLPIQAAYTVPIIWGSRKILAVRVRS